MVQVFNWHTVGGDLFEPLEDRLDKVEIPREDRRFSRIFHHYDWKYRRSNGDWAPQYDRDGTRYHSKMDR